MNHHTPTRPAEAPAVRDHAPSDGSAYFLYHSIGQYPGKAADLAAAMAGFASAWSACDTGQWGDALGRRAAFIDRWSALIGAAPGTLTTVENVTAGLHAVLTALPDATLRGRTVLIAADCFPSNHFLLTGLAARMGFRLQTVPMRQGASWVEDDDVLDAWTPDVALALLTWVSSTSSHRIELQRLVAHGRSLGSLIGADITQGAGLLPFNVGAPAVDFTLSTSLKWMCGTPGAGILHVVPALTALCQPEFRGWFSQPDPFSWALDRFEYAPDVRRFDTGTPSVMAAAASLPALDWHAGLDHEGLLAHNRHLCAQILAGTDALGLVPVSPRDEGARGGSIMLRLPDSHPAGALCATLGQRDVHADARGQVLRLSPGFVTTDDGVARLLDALAEAVR